MSVARACAAHPKVEVRALRLSAGVPAAFAASLDDGERAHLVRLARPDDRSRFVAAHGLLRALFAEVTGLPAAAPRYCPEPGGRPWLHSDALAAPPAVSLAHSGDVVVCAFAAEGAVGVDVEVVRDVADLDGVARRLCRDAELAAFPPAADRAGWLDAFYRCWCAKEAYLKARGEGLRGDPRELALALAAPPGALLAGPPGATLEDLDLGADVRAALVWLPDVTPEAHGASGRP